MKVEIQNLGTAAGSITQPLPAGGGVVALPAVDAVNASVFGTCGGTLTFTRGTVTTQEILK